MIKLSDIRRTERDDDGQTVVQYSFQLAKTVRLNDLSEIDAEIMDENVASDFDQNIYGNIQLHVLSADYAIGKMFIERCGSIPDEVQEIFKELRRICKIQG